MFRGEQEIERLVTWIRTWFEENGPTAKAVVGVSGGKDSSVCAALLTQALGKDRVQAVLIPDGEQADIRDSWLLARHLELEPLAINIAPVTAAIKAVLSEQVFLSEDARINLPPRVRMATRYAILDIYIREGICKEEAIKAKIDKMHQQNLHKLKPVPTYRHEI